MAILPPSRQLLPAAAVLLAAAALPWIAPPYYVQLATKVLIMGIAAMALNLAVGFGGMVSMCHAAFFGFAGYLLALGTPESGPASLWLALPLAVGAAGLLALAIGALSLRARGVYFIMVTLAFGEMLFYLFHDTQIAGGSDGAFVHFKPIASIGGWSPIDLERPAAFFGVVLALTVAVVALLRAITASPFGRALAAARDNERRARALGFPVYRVRLVAFTISGALAGLAGFFGAAQFGFVAPQLLGWHHSATILVMVVLGGMGTVTGPLVGAVVLLGLEEVLKATTPHWKLIEGAIVILLVLALPGGARQLAAMVVPALGERDGKPAPPARDARRA